MQKEKKTELKTYGLIPCKMNLAKIIDKERDRIIGSLMRKFNNIDLLKDSFQEACISMIKMQNEGRYLNEESAAYYLRVLTKNRAIDFLKLKQSRMEIRVSEFTENKFVSDYISLEDLRQQEFETNFLDKEIQNLKPNQKKMLEEHLFNGRKVIDIGEEMGVGSNTAVGIMYHAKTNLRKALNKY